MVSEPDGKGGLRWVEGGVITLADGSARKFYEFDLLKPYVAAWETRVRTAWLPSSQAKKVAILINDLGNVG